MIMAPAVSLKERFSKGFWGHGRAGMEMGLAILKQELKIQLDLQLDL